MAVYYFIHESPLIKEIDLFEMRYFLPSGPLNMGLHFVVKVLVMVSHDVSHDVRDSAKKINKASQVGESHCRYDFRS